MPRRKKPRTDLTEPKRSVRPTPDAISLGRFRHGHLVTFNVCEEPGEDADAIEYRAYATDGPAGPSLVCYVTPDSEVDPVWRGSWRGDDWCGRIEAQARKIIANATAGY